MEKDKGDLDDATVEPFLIFCSTPGRSIQGWGWRSR